MELVRQKLKFFEQDLLNLINLYQVLSLKKASALRLLMAEESYRYDVGSPPDTPLENL
jgi:hypothetical protein